MKRIITILLVLLFFLLSCGQEKKAPDFECYPITMSGTLTCGGNSCAITVVAQGKDSLDISIDSPKGLAGYSFKVDNSKVWVYYDGMQIELENGSIDIPFSLFPEILSVSLENFEYSRTDEKNVIYYYKKDGNSTVIYVKRATDTPCRIEYTKDNRTVIFDIESFIIQ